MAAHCSTGRAAAKTATSNRRRRAVKLKHAFVASNIAHLMAGTATFLPFAARIVPGLGGGGPQGSSSQKTTTRGGAVLCQASSSHRNNGGAACPGQHEVTLTHVLFVLLLRGAAELTIYRNYCIAAREGRGRNERRSRG